MYERFTDRARKCLQLANQQAQKFNHSCIGTEHLLLGILWESTGMACLLLDQLGVDRDKLVVSIKERMQPGSEMIQMGKLPQTPRTRMVLERAIDSARGLGNNYIGSEHLLLGLLDEVALGPVSIPALVLAEFNVIYDQVLAAVKEMQSPLNIQMETAGEPKEVGVVKSPPTFTIKADVTFPVRAPDGTTIGFCREMEVEIPGDPHDHVSAIADLTSVPPGMCVRSRSYIISKDGKLLQCTTEVVDCPREPLDYKVEVGVQDEDVERIRKEFERLQQGRASEGAQVKENPQRLFGMDRQEERRRGLAIVRGFQERLKAAGDLKGATLMMQVAKEMEKDVD